MARGVKGDEAPETASLALVRMAISAKTAADIGLPRLAAECARECRRIAEQVIVELSPAIARLSVEQELVATGSLTVGDLAGLVLRAYGPVGDAESTE